MALPIVTGEPSTQASGATLTVSLLSAPHVADDILMVCVNSDGSTPAITADATTAAAGWAEIGTSQSNDAHRQTWFWLKAVGSSTVDPVFNVVSGSRSIGTPLVIRDADPTTPIHQYARQDIAAFSVGGNNSTTVTTTVDDCLLIYSWCADGVSTYLRASSNDLICLTKQQPGSSCQIIGYRQQGAQGVSPVVPCYSTATTEGGTGWVIAIKNKTGGARAFDCRSGADEFAWHGNFGAIHGAWGTSGAPNSIISSGTLDGVDISSIAGAVTQSNSTFATSSWGTPTLIASTEITAGKWVGSVRTLAANKDMSGKVYYAHLQTPTGNATVQGSKGVAIVFADSGGDWVAYQACDYNAMVISQNRPIQIALEQATTLGSSGSMDWTAVAKIGYFWHRVGSTNSQQSAWIKNETLYSSAYATGGGSAYPAVTADIQRAIVSWGHYEAANLQGSSQVLGKHAITIGDGTEKTYFSASASSFEYPSAFAHTNGLSQQAWNVNAGQTAYTIYASANDTIDLSAAVLLTPTAQPFTIHASSSTSATYSFVGTSFIGWTVTWKTGIPCIGASFKQCGEINAKGADFTNVTISDTASTDAAIAFDTSGVTMSSCTIDVTGTSAAYHIELGASVTGITLADVTFTGTPGTDKVHVLATTGTVTIVISGSTILAAGDVTSAGATVVISGPTINQSVTISNITTTSRVQIYDESVAAPVGSRELYNGIPGATSITWTDSLQAVATRDIRVRISDVVGTSAKMFIEASIGTCGITEGTEDVSYLANQTNDTTYNTNAENGSTVTGITFTDAATDLVNINIASGSITWQKIYAAFVYWISTETGIADDIAYVNGVDPANYLLTSMKIKNTSSPSVPLTITGGFGRDATTGSIVDIIDTTGGNIYPLVDHVVSNIVSVAGENVITGDIADIPAAPTVSEIWGESKALTVGKFLGLK